MSFRSDLRSSAKVEGARPTPHVLALIICVVGLAGILRGEPIGLMLEPAISLAVAAFQRPIVKIWGDGRPLWRVRPSRAADTSPMTEKTTWNP